MRTPPYDLHDYLFDELEPAERAEMERFLAESAEARQELERLRLTHQAMLRLPDEEPPRRIAFVSDKVFEPSPPRRFWRWLGDEGPRFAYGLAMVLAVVFAGLWVTEPAVRATADGWEIAFGPAAGAAPATAVEGARPALTAEQVRRIVRQAVAESEQRQQEALARLASRQTSPPPAAAPAVTRRELEELRADSEFAWRLLQTRLDEILKQAAQVDLASLER